MNSESSSQGIEGTSDVFRVTRLMHLAAGTLDRYVFILLRGRCEICDGETAHDEIKMKIKRKRFKSNFAWVV